MNKWSRSFAVFCTAACLLGILFSLPALAANPKPIVIPAYKHDVSPPLRSLATRALPAMNHQIIKPEVELPPLPGAPLQGKDPVLQTVPLPKVGTIAGLDFEGVAANGYAPPDTNGAVGTTQYFQIVNVEFAIYNKTTGAIEVGPSLINSIWSGFGGDCDTGGNGGDPIVLFDHLAQRWVVSQLSGTYNSWCMAVSQTDDATGSYYRYAFSSGGNLDDYPKLAVWPDAYYRATNTFTGGFVGAKACAYDRSSMLTGGNANAICFQESSSVAGLLPSDLDGSNPPPSGAPDYYVELASTSSLGLFQFHVDFGTPSNSTFNQTATITVASFSEACGGFGACIPQPSGDGTQLDSLGDRLMFRLAYRNFGDHESLVVTHSVTAGSSTGARWYEIQSPGGTPTINQQGTFAPDSNYRWMGSIAMDQVGDMALGYSVSSSSVHPAIRYTGRVPGDPLGQMESEASIYEGTGSQTGGLNRWGDYSAMSVDPTDDCTFWYTTEYIPSDGSFNWHTRIGNFAFPSCNGTPTFTLTAAPGSQSVVVGGSATYTATATPYNGYSGTVTLSVSGCPTGATCTLNPTQLNLPPAGSSTLSVQTSGSTPTGNYTITITGTDGTNTRTTTVNLSVTAFTITATPASQIVKKGSSTSYTVKVAAVNGFGGVVSLTVSGLPALATGTFSPTTITGSGSSTLTVSTARKSPVGSYTLKITGTSGGLALSANVTLVVSNNGKK